MLCLNSEKTEVIWVSTPRRQHQLPELPMLINGWLDHPVRALRHLGVLIDADLVMRSHLTRVVTQCFSVLRHLRLISRMLSPSTLETVFVETVLVTLVLSRLDYANSVLIGWPAYLVKRLPLVINVIGSSEQRTPAIRTCFWNFDFAALIAHPRAYPIQIGGSISPSSLRKHPKLHRTVHSAVRRCKSIITQRSTTSHLLLIYAHPASSSLDYRCNYVSGVWPALWNSLPSDIICLSTVYQSYFVISKIICSSTRIQALFNNK